MKGKKLVIFDIDGTLIRALRPIDNLQRFRYSIQKIFKKDIGPITEERWHKGNYNGMGDRAILWVLVEPFGISRDMFLDQIGLFGDAFIEYLDSIAAAGPSYAVIPEAKRLSTGLSKRSISRKSTYRKFRAICALEAAFRGITRFCVWGVWPRSR